MKHDTGLLASAVRMRGSLRGTANMRIEGALEGEVALAGSFVVGKGGHVVGPVQATEVTIEGLVTGNVAATKSVSVREGGQLQGDVRASNLSVEEGASISGMVDMIFDDGSRAP